MMRNYLKFKLFCVLQNPLFFIISLAFNLFCPVYFFLIKKENSENAEKTVSKP